MATKLNVIDVSEHQGTIGWETAKQHIDGAIIRCGYGDDIVSQDDEQFARNLSECERLNIPHGAYLYSYADTTEHAQSELQHILRLIRGHSFQLPIYIDCEASGTEKFAPTACKIICDGIAAAGFTPGVYANTSWWNNHLTTVTGYSRWVAQYNSVCTYGGTYDMWQYTETGSVPGISVPVDISYCYTKFTDMVGTAEQNKTNVLTATKIIETACSYIGTYDGGNNDVIFNTHYYGKSVSGDKYPWCCAFVWDIFRMCGASDLFCDGLKTAYCPTVLEWGRSNGLTVGKSNGQYGDIVLFDWNGDGVADHIGLIISTNTDGSYITVEGNTANSNYSNGGYVLKMTRYQSQIIGIIRPKYDATASTTPTNATPDIYYQVYTDKSGWLPTVKNTDDYAGIDGQAIKGIRVRVDGDTVAVETHQLTNGSIDRLTIYAGKHTVRYRVRTIGSSNYLDWMENKRDTGGSSDTYAGMPGKPIDRFQAYIKE